MARKKLNKRLVGIISLVALAIAVLGVVLAVQYFYQDPEPYLEEGRRVAAEIVQLRQEIEAQVAAVADPEAAAERRRELSKEQLKPMLEKMHRAYGNAYKFARSNRELKLAALEERGELFEQIGEYEAARQWWNLIIREQAGHVQARERLLAYDHERARYAPRGAWHQLWPQVETDAQELMEWSPDDPWPVLVAAEAQLCLLEVGVKTDKAGTLAAIEGLLEQVRANDPENLDALRVAAQFALYRGDQAKADERKAYEEQAEQLLRAGIASHPDEVEAYRNLFEILRARQVEEKFIAAAQAGAAEQESLQAEARKFASDAVQELEEWKQRFTGQGLFAALQAGLRQRGLKEASKLPEVAALFEEAIACEEVEPQWRAALVEIYRILSESSQRQRAAYLEKAYMVGRNALYLPELTQISGPRYSRDMTVRFTLLQLHTEVCCARAEISEGELRQTLLAEARATSQQLSDAIGAERPESMLAAGRIALAEGNRDEAIRRFYTVFQQQQETGEVEGSVRLRLFDALKDTRSGLLAVRYGLAGLVQGAGTARSCIECLELACHERLDPMARRFLLDLADNFKRRFALDDSYDGRLKLAHALLLLQNGQQEEAQAMLTEVKDPDSREWQMAWVRCLPKVEQRYEVLGTWFQEHPADIEVARMLAQHYMRQGAEDAAWYDRARSVVQTALEQEPHDVQLLVTQRLLESADPTAVEPAQQRQMVLEVIEQLPAGADRQFRLASYYDSEGQVAQSQDRLQQASEAWVQAEQAYRQALEHAGDDTDLADEATSSLMELLLRQGQYAKAAAVAGEVARKNSTQGLLFEARLYAAQGKWSEAAARARDYLKSKPISVAANLLLTQCYEEMGETATAMTYARAAVEAGPDDAGVNQNLLRLLHQQNEQLGFAELDVPRLLETIRQLEITLMLNPESDYAGQLRVIYYSLYVTAQMRRLEENPAMPLEQRQEGLDRLAEIHQKAVETCRALLAQDSSRDEIWRTLAAVVFDYGRVVPDKQESARLIARAGEILKEGLAACPDSELLVRAYNAYLEQTGQADQAQAELAAAVEQSTGEQQRTARLNLARFYLRQDQSEAALEQIETVLEEEPANNEALEMLAGLKLRQGQIEESLAVYERADLDANSSLRAKYAEVLIYADRLDDAAEQVRIGQQRDAENVVWLLLQGRLAQQQGDTAGAVQAAQAALEREPDNLTAYRLKAQALLTAKQTEEAIAVLQEMRTKLSEQNNLGRLELARAYWTLGRRQQALTTLEAAVAADPGDLAFARELASVLRELERWSRLEQLYDDMIARYANNAAIYVQAADAAIARGRVEQQQGHERPAREQYTRARRLLETALTKVQAADHGATIIRQRLADLYLLVADPQTALMQIDPLLETTPEDPRLLAHKAQILAAQKRTAESLDLFARALLLSRSQADVTSEVLGRMQNEFQPRQLVEWCNLQLAERPDQPLVRLVLARAHAQQGRVDEQLQELQRIIESTETPPEMQVVAANEMAVAYLNQGDNAAAAKCFERIHALEPENVTVLNNLAYLLLELPGREAEGSRLATQAYEMNPNDPVIMDTYAFALLNDKDYSRAETLLRQAIQRLRSTGQPARPEFHYRLGQALQGLNRISEATQQYELTLQYLAQGAYVPSAGQLQQQASQALEALRQDSQQQ